MEKNTRLSRAVTRQEVPGLLGELVTEV